MKIYILNELIRIIIASLNNAPNMSTGSNSRRSEASLLAIAVVMVTLASSSGYYDIPHMPPMVYEQQGDVIIGGLFVMHYYR